MVRVLPVLGAGLMGAVVLPLLLPVLPVGGLDVDPRVGGGMIDGGAGGGVGVIGWGPRGAAWLAVVTAGLAVAGGVLAVWAGARVRWGSVALAGVGLIWCVGHMTVGAVTWEDWRQGGAWAAAVVSALGVLHLGSAPGLPGLPGAGAALPGAALPGAGAGARRWMVAVLVGVLVPVAADAVWETRVEHRWNVEYYEANRAEVLAKQGIEPGSEQEQLYARRMGFNDATGNLGLSNVLASLAGAFTAMGAGLTGGLLLRRSWGVGAAVGVAVLGGAVTVTLTHSSGGAVGLMAALGVGAVAVGAWWWGGRLRGQGTAAASGRVKRGWSWVMPAAAVGVVALAFGAVLVRGAMGVPLPPPEGALVEGERSLLFRYQYWSAGARLWGEAPLAGVGPSGIAEGYPRVKDPLNPETVSSLHNVFVDNAVMFGVGGLAWGALLVGWLWRAGCVAERGVMGPGPLGPGVVGGEAGVDGGVTGRGATWLAGGVVAGVYAAVLPAVRPGLVPESALLTLAAAGGMWWVIRSVGDAADLHRRWLDLGLFMAAVVLLVHNQIEMTFFQTGSATLAWCVVALAASGWEDRDPVTRAAGRRGAWPLAVLGALAVGGALGGTVWYAVRVDAHESAAERAAAAMRRGDTAAALSHLEAMQGAAGVDDRALTWRVRLAVLEPLMRGEQAGAALNRDRAGAAVDDALRWIDDARRAGAAPLATARLEASLREAAAPRLGGSERLDAAVAAYRRLNALSSYNLDDRLALADLLAAAGNRDAAATEYRRVLKLRRQKYLDPAEPLRTEDLRRIERYLGDTTQ